MGFIKTARAVVVHPNVTGPQWSGLRKTASISPSRDLIAQANDILGGPLNPDSHLITHCTIVASVDVQPVPGVRTGTLRVGSKTIDRRWPDYLITQETDRYINNNQDAFPRGVLLKAYKTFVGGHNFQEHVQIEAQSKGRIIDAVARDIGDSVYVDILVATDRKHASLVGDIESGRLGTLSMGCVCDFTQCTKCGNVSADEPGLCDCVRFEKGNYFFDDAGNKRRVAELCGHESLSGGGVRFIEASWVAVPAFTGAVMRNILAPAGVAAAGIRARKILASPPPQWDSDANLRSASFHVRGFDLGDDMGGDDSAAPAEKPEAKDPLAEAEDKLYGALRERVVSRIQKDLEPKPPAASPDGTLSNGNLQHDAAYRIAMNGMTRVASDRKSLITGIASINAAFGVRIPNSIYRLAAQIGPRADYASDKHFLKACEKFAGRVLKPAEIRTILRVGSLLPTRGGKQFAHKE